VQLTHELVTLHLGRAFASNRGVTTAVKQLVVRLAWDGHVGLGTAVLARDATDLPAVTAALDAVRLAETPLATLQALDDQPTAATPPAHAAIDLALHDLLCRAASVSLHRLWGIAVPSAPTAISIGQLPDPERLARARELAAWPILKLKLAAGAELAIVARLREVYAGRIWIDGNGAWSPDEALAAAEIFQRAGVELLEQPIRAGTPDLLRYVRERSAVPIVADEDCVGPDDVARLAGCVDAINIKLVKCGGLRRARRMIALARAAGLRVMLGCKTESALGVTAMAQLGGLADYLDLDGHLELVDDPFVGLGVDRGRITLSEAPGLGVRMRS
jgi:L-alanine-DL-glutamate epimerase-like enolase superfamily enzyme